MINYAPKTHHIFNLLETKYFLLIKILLVELDIIILWRRTYCVITYYMWLRFAICYQASVVKLIVLPSLFCVVKLTICCWVYHVLLNFIYNKSLFFSFVLLCLVSYMLALLLSFYNVRHSSFNIRYIFIFSLLSLSFHRSIRSYESF